MKRAIKVIRTCNQFGQLEGAKNYAKLAGVWEEPLVKEWFTFKRLTLKPF